MNDHPRPHLTTCAFALLLVLGGTSAIVAQTVTPGSYSYEIFEAPGGVSTEASDIDKWGTIVGYTDDGDENAGFILENGTLSSFELPGWVNTTIIGTSDKGHLVGDVEDEAGQLRGYLWDDGDVTIYDVPGSDLTIALDVNKKGQVTGFYRTPANQRFAFVADGDDFESFSAPGAGPLGTRASGINQKGDVSGVFFDANGAPRGFIRWHNGGFETVDFPGAQGTFLGRISTNGKVVVGSYLDANFQFRGFLRDAAGNFVTFDPPGSAGTIAVGLTQDGRIVGSYDDPLEPGRAIGYVATPLD